MELLIIILVLVVVLVLPNIKIVPQAKSYVVERLGSYLCTWGNGLHIKIPFIDRVSNQVTLKEIVKDFDPQPVITTDRYCCIFSNNRSKIIYIWSRKSNKCDREFNCNYTS